MITDSKTFVYYCTFSFIVIITSATYDKPSRRHRNLSTTEDEMRYFIYYPPTKSIRQIDVIDTVRVQDIIKQVKHEFHLTSQGSGQSETSIVLNYNGSDLKPKWTVGDLGIPSGAIIRCLYREKKAADLYVYCAFNRQIVKLFDSTITLETTIGTIRKKLSDTLGLPLSTFCLENRDGRVRYYDHMKLINYDIKLNGRICHMDLAISSMQMGGRNDRSVGEHPSRQWSSVFTEKSLPEIEKCPFHIAIEQAQMKIVDLFVRHNILCTQVRHPVNGYLPYRLALNLSSQANVNQLKDKQQLYSEIFFYLYDKQFNLKIPLNANGEHIQALLGSSTSVGVITHYSQHHVLISLKLYCKIIKWYECARESAWKKHGGNFYSNPQAKRIYPKTGLLGYKVLIDGYNNTFDVVHEQFLQQQSSVTKQIGDSDYVERYFGKDDYEKQKYLRMKTYMKQCGLDDRHRKGNVAPTFTDQRRFMMLRRQLPYIGKIDQNKDTKAFNRTTTMPTSIQPSLPSLTSSAEFLRQQSNNWQVTSSQQLIFLPTTSNESVSQELSGSEIKHLATEKSMEKGNTIATDNNERTSIVNVITIAPSTTTQLTTTTITSTESANEKR
ncbi:unnamed protein product, partial [Didymodactylos carnosus]